MTNCQIIIVNNDQIGSLCGKYAKQTCMECGTELCDTHTYICCDKILGACCIAQHKCTEATCA
jgi:hypothetical protein